VNVTGVLTFGVLLDAVTFTPITGRGATVMPIEAVAVSPPSEVAVAVIV
jgi:hypothetical protein